MGWRLMLMMPMIAFAQDSSAAYRRREHTGNHRDRHAPEPVADVPMMMMAARMAAFWQGTANAPNL